MPQFLPPTARAVVFGNGTIAKLLSLSQKVCAAAEGKSASEQLALYRQFLHDSRSYFSDQITSRSLGHVPLQSFLQSNSKARSIALFFILFSHKIKHSFASLHLLKCLWWRVF